MANALEAASLVMIPSGYEDGTLGSLKPTDGTGDFTFSRGSNLSATRINEQGYIEKGYENLLLQSNSFDTTAWNISNVTGGQEGYDGTNDAWLQSGGSRLQQAISLGTSVYTYSLYLKAGYSNFCEIRVVGSKSIVVRYELTGSGSIITSSNTIDSKIELIGNNWYRVSGAFNASVTTFRIYPKDNSSGSQSSSSSIYIQDAMLNQGLVAYPYIETTTAPVAGGILEDMPRLDYSNGSCPALLLEPQRTNAIAHSEYIGNTTNSTISRNDGVSPEGVENASKVTITGTSQAGITTSNAYVSLSTTYTQSCYVKKDVGDYFGFGLFQLGMPINNNNYVRWNLSDINATPSIQGSYTNAKAEDAGNGWIRLSATIITTSSSTRSGWKFLGMTSSNNFQTSAVGDSFYLYGLQAEPDATYPTSYIPTYGVSQTRLADDVDLNLSSAWDSTGSWTIFFERERIIDDSINFDNNFQIEGNGSFYLRDRSNNIQLLVIASGLPISSAFTNTINQGDTYRIAVKWDGSNMKAFHNGDEITFNNPSTYANSFYQFVINTKHKKYKEVYFPTALSDSECIALTTI